MQPHLTPIPAAAATGTATVTVTVSDAIASTSETFVVSTPTDAVATPPSDDDNGSKCGFGGSDLILHVGSLTFLGLRRPRT